ncbi:MAG: hydrogenase-3 subunit E [Firmicutes bacterium]|nr:hydrogenase-3 subunit E [Bacillota bacterium]
MRVEESAVVGVRPEAFGAEVHRRLRHARPSEDAPVGTNLIALWEVREGGEVLVEAVLEEGDAVVRLQAPWRPELVWPSEAGARETALEEARLMAVAQGEGRYGTGPAHAVAARGAFTFPIGPVRGDVMESAALTLTGMGDEVLGLRVDLGWKVRRVQQAAVGLPVAEAVRVVEHTTATSAVAHALAFSQAVEAARGRPVTGRAAVLRSILAEIERAHSHLLDLASLAGATGLPAAQQELMALRESVLRTAYALVGHRYLRGAVAPGGLAVDPGDRAWVEAAMAVVRLGPALDRIVADLDATPSFLDRLHAAGIVKSHEAVEMGALGPVGRASGSGPDCRRHRPYAGYVGHPPSPLPYDHAGDAWARWRVKTAEVRASLSWLEQAAVSLPDRCREEADPIPAGGDGWGLGRAEGPRGEVVYAVRLDPEGRTAGVWARTPSLRNWALLPVAVARRNVLQDVPIIEASFALSAAGSDM